MDRDWGVTSSVVEWRADEFVWLYELMSLPGDLLVVVSLLGVLGVYSLYRGVKSTSGPLVTDRIGVIAGVVIGGLALVVIVESLVPASRPPLEWHLIEASPYGFPSGHTLAALVTWGAVLVWYVEEWSVWVRGGVLVLLVSVVGVSRLLLGVHYLPDVLASLVIGSLYLVVCWRVLSGNPWRAFALGGALAIVGVVVSGGGSRGVIAFVGAVGAVIGWWVISQDVVRGRVRGVIAG